MRIEQIDQIPNFSIEKSKPFNPVSTKKEIIFFGDETIKKVCKFSYDMTFGKEGEHRPNRSGGKIKRDELNIFINTFQGKLAEIAIYKLLKSMVKLTKDELQEPDFNVYGSGIWDGADIICKGYNIAIKSTKSFGNLLLLEIKDWSSKGEYIPNIEKEKALYDYIVLARIGCLIQQDKYDSVENTLKNFIFKTYDDFEQHLIKVKLCFDVTGYITLQDLIQIILNKQIIKQGNYLNK